MTNNFKKIVTTDILLDSIQDDFTWRDKELRLIKQAIPTAKNEKQTAFIRSAIPILYAHWEGFVKKVSEHYLEYVSYYSEKYLKNNELKPQFITLSLNKALGKTEIKNIIDKTEVVKYLISNFETTPLIPKDNIIQTKGNLKFEIFKEILFTLSIDIKEFIKYESLINDLVNDRNTIAHGNRNHKLIDYETYLKTYQETLILMRHYKNEVENSAVQKKFKI